MKVVKPLSSRTERIIDHLHKGHGVSSSPQPHYAVPTRQAVAEATVASQRNAASHFVGTNNVLCHIASRVGAACTQPLHPSAPRAKSSNQSASTPLPPFPHEHKHTYTHRPHD
jgi:hypothetical protein